LHCLVKLPHVLDTAVLGRIFHNGRVVHQEMKRGNIKPAKLEEAWKIIEVGLLASRYATFFANSMSMASFNKEDVDSDAIDRAVQPTMLVLADYCKEYVKN